MRSIVPREWRDLNESCNKILRFAQDDLLSQVRFLSLVEMTDPPARWRAGSVNPTFYELVNYGYENIRGMGFQRHYHGLFRMDSFIFLLMSR
ncbi:MAG: hypothetical protein JRI72_08380 [Deltaproteobacteria bacterium]|nr:hypothetical protein [Deltaproteobacteria bacterium]